MKSIDMIHKANLEMLKEVDRVCKKNNIEYFLESGTLLGAVRHKGFIPWDDDIDLLVKRENINDFFKACQRDLDSSYEIIYTSDMDNYFWDFIPRITLRNSQLRNPTDEDISYDNKQNKVSLDIFILDSTSPNRIGQKIHVLRHLVVYGLAMGHRYKINYEKYSFSTKLAVFMLSKIGSFFSLESILKLQERVSTKYERKKSQYCMVSNYIIQEIGCIFEKQWYNEIVRLPFEDGLLDCPVGWDCILTTLYGDYMRLPDENKRLYAHINEQEVKIAEQKNSF